MSEESPATGPEVGSDAAAEEAAPGYEAEYEAQYEPEPRPMPAGGRLAVAGLWLNATALCVCFAVVAVVLVFDLSAAEAPAGSLARGGAAAAFGLLAAAHVVVAVNLRPARAWARVAAVVLLAAAVAACALGVGIAFTPRFDYAARAAGAFMLGAVLYGGLTAAASTRALRDWCRAGAADLEPPVGDPRLLR